MLPEKFTLTELQKSYELILGMKLDKRNFRKKVLTGNVLKELNEYTKSASKRPAMLYSFDNITLNSKRGHFFKISRYFFIFSLRLLKFQQTLPRYYTIIKMQKQGGFNMKIAFFDAKPYDKPSFDRYGKENGVKFKYFETKLNEDTVELANGYDGVCVFVNDNVNDAVIDRLAEMYNPKKVTRAYIEFVDIAGLVKGASKGEGLGNKFLSHIREVDAIIHVVRCFEDTNITHVDGSVDPARDIETINLDYDMDEDEVKKYNVGDVLPVFIFYKDDEEVIRVVGEKSEEQLLKIIEEIGD